MIDSGGCELADSRVLLGAVARPFQENKGFLPKLEANGEHDPSKIGPVNGRIMLHV